MSWLRGRGNGDKSQEKKGNMLDNRQDRQDKAWAKRYILDPLTDPEPHQLDGPGTSFFNPRRNLALNRTPEQNRVNDLQRRTKNPASPDYHHPKSTTPGRRHSHRPSPGPTSADAVARSDHHKSKSVDSRRLEQHQSSASRPPSSSRSSKIRPSRKPPQTHGTRGTAESVTEILAERSASAINTAAPSPVLSKAPPSPTGHTLRRSTSHIPPKLSAMASSTRSVEPGAQTHTRQTSGHSRKHQSRRRGQPLADSIDSLDKTGFGGAYHHGGPYDATLAAVNKNKKYAPLEAVKDSNLEALRATPREYIADSLQRHIPLQGTGTIPSGMPDMNGNIMNYKEGADLMREADAPGGAFMRYDFIKYHPDDLKGKGEPSFSIERSLKEQSSKPYRHKVSASYGGGSTYEMKNQFRPLLTPSKDANASIRRSSFSSATTGASWRASSPLGPGPRPRAQDDTVYSTQTDMRRNTSTGNRITEGLKRRLGSLRRK